MTTTVEAVYEQGVLRLVTPLELAEGTHVEVIIIAPDANQHLPSPSAILADIAALPMEPDGQEFSGRDHDRILYGKDSKS